MHADHGQCARSKFLHSLLCWARVDRCRHLRLISHFCLGKQSIADGRYLSIYLSIYLSVLPSDVDIASLGPPDWDRNVRSVGCPLRRVLVNFIVTQVGYPTTGASGPESIKIIDRTTTSRGGQSKDTESFYVASSPYSFKPIAFAWCVYH